MISKITDLDVRIYEIPVSNSGSGGGIPSMSAHNLCLEKVVAEDRQADDMPQWIIPVAGNSKMAFKKFCRILFSVDEDDWPHFCPDAFAVSAGDRTIYLLEIEGSNPITSKLDTLAEFWFDLDSDGWELEIYTVNLKTGARAIVGGDEFRKIWIERLEVEYAGS